jgi:cell division protein FtsB
MLRSRRRRPLSRSARALRLLGIAVLLAIGFAYWQPVRAYVSARDEVAARQDEKAALVSEQKRLERRLASADTDAFIEREARRIGFVKPGQRLFIVTGLGEP